MLWPRALRRSPGQPVGVTVATSSPGWPQSQARWSTPSITRYAWVVTKLALVVSVLAVGGFVIGPATSRLLDGDTDATRLLIVGASYDVIALAFATMLSVFKPGRRFRRNEPTRKGGG